MDIDGLPIVGASVDLTKVPSIHSKRTLAFLNHFICQTANFLNKFACVCETKLEDINTRIQRIETSLSILEAKLSSVPGLDDIKLQSSAGGAQDSAVQQSHRSATTEASPLAPRVDGHINDESTSVSSPRNQSTTVEDQRKPAVAATDADVTNDSNNSSLNMTVSQDPRYAKYFKFLQVGVPAMALRPKMVADGLDPDLLDKPNAPAPPYNSDKEISERSDSDSEIGSDFSD